MQVRDIDEHLLTNEGEQTKRWAEHVRAVLNRAVPDNPLHEDEPSKSLAIDTEPPLV